MGANLAEIAHENLSYRRGLVLGLTMAEIVVLIIFVLLLALAGLLGNKERQLAALADDNKKLEDHVNQLIEVNGTLTELLPKSRKFDDLFQELTLTRKRLNQQAEHIAVLEEKAVRDEPVVRAVDTAPVPGDTTERKAIELVTRAKITRAALAAAGMDTERPITSEMVPEANKRLAEMAAARDAMEAGGSVLEKTMSELQETKKSLARAEVDLQLARSGSEQYSTHVSTLKGQLANIKARLEGNGRGTERPACWATEAGKPEYIFDMVLTSTGIVVRDNALPPRRGEQRALPISSIMFGREISLTQFRQTTQALFDWSQANDCRFFVRTFDSTGPTEKATYKRHLRTVGEHFYYFEPVGGTF